MGDGVRGGGSGSGPVGLTRRAVLAGTAALPAVTLGPGAFAQAAPTVFRAVGVDVSPLDRYGGGGARNLLQPALEAEMRSVFADILQPGNRTAPVVTARITELYMSFYDGQQTTDAFGGNDNIEGDGIVSISGRVLSTTHILTELPPTYSGALVTPNLDLIRYQSIAHQFAWWLRREMGV